MSQHLPDSRYAAFRLGVTLALMTLGSAGMYVVPVALPAVQADFGVARADASLPYTLLMIGFGIGGMAMGRLADRFGVSVPLLIGAAGLGLGFAGAAVSASIWWFALAHGLLIGLVGSSATFAPLIADTSLWFVRRRGIAVAICASGNYLGGAIWPPIVQHFIASAGWRATYLGLAHDGLVQPAHAIVPAVGMEVGAEVRTHRQLQLPRRLQGAPAQRTLGGNVDQVRAPARPQRQQGAPGRQTHAQLRIARNRQAPHQHLMEALGLGGLVVGALARTDQLQVVLAGLEPLDHAADGARHPVDLGWIGLGHHRDPQVPVVGRMVVDQDHIGGT